MFMLNDKLFGSKVLWTNPNPSRGFGGQVISISNLSDYKYIDIVYFTYVGELKQCVKRHYYNNNYNNGELFSIFTFNGAGYMGSRPYSVYSDSIAFDTNYDFVSSPAWSGMSIGGDDNWNIPYKIIGYK